MLYGEEKEFSIHCCGCKKVLLNSAIIFRQREKERAVLAKEDTAITAGIALIKLPVATAEPPARPL
jgi:hypothetical protein